MKNSEQSLFVDKPISKDWTGSAKSVFRQTGCSQHSQTEREENDYYATEPRAATMLLGLQEFSQNIWEPACGEGHLSKELTRLGKNVKSTDLIDRGYGIGGIDFLKESDIFNGDIITNPPYRYAKEFVLKALDLIPEGNRVAMFLKLQFMEGKGRKAMFESFPPKTIYVSSSRINCAKNADFEGMRTSGGSVVAFAWYVWEKGFNGDTVVKWFN